MFNNVVINFIECCRHEHHRHATSVQFAGAYHVNPKTGEIVVADQHVPGASAETGQLVFKDQNGAPIKGPVGTITSTDTTNPPSLSADGQNYNFTSPAATPADQTIVLTWTDPSGKISPVSNNFIVDAVPLVASTVEFGTAAPGTTP